MRLTFRVFGDSQALLGLPDGNHVLLSAAILEDGKRSYCMEELPTGWLSSGPTWPRACEKLIPVLSRFTSPTDAEVLTENIVQVLELLRPARARSATRWDFIYGRVVP